MICRKLNWREGDRTQMTGKTKNAVIVLEGFPPFTQPALGEALQVCSSCMQQYCGGRTREVILTKEQHACSLGEL